MLPENEALFQKFYREKDAQKSPELMKLDSSILRRFEEHVNKPMLQVTKDDVVNYFYNMKLGAYSIEIHKMQIKKFFKWLYNFDETQKVPEQVSWYKSNRAKAYKHKTKAEIPTKEEVQLILDSCSNILERCVVSVLYDSAARLGEFCKLKVGDVVQKDGEYCICVSGKTGQRTIPLNFSLKYLLEYLDAHPMRNDPKALLWLSRRGEGYTKFGMSALIKAIIARSGIQKRTTAHMLRHSRLTELTHVGLVESETRVFAGWTPESNMPSIYLHINSDDMLQAVRRVEPKVNYVDKEKMETENLTQLEQRMEQKMKEMEDRYIQKILELQHPDLEKQPIEVQEKVVQDTHELQDYLNLVADTEPEQ